MTKSTISTLLILLCVVLIAPPAPAKDAPLPDGVVARVTGRDLTFDGLCRAAAQQKVHELMNRGSTVASTLRQLMEEYIVTQEAQRLGVDVSKAKVDARFKQYDTELRRRSGGNMTIQEMMRREGMSIEEMRTLLAHQLRQEAVARHPENLGDTLPKNESERLAQLKVVLEKIVSRTVKKIYVRNTFGWGIAKDGQPDWIASVQVHSSMQPKVIDRAAFGRALVLRLSTGEVRGILDRECKTGLMAASGVSLTDPQFDEEIALATRLWLIERELASQAAFKDVSYEMFVEASFGIKVEEMKRQRYYRGYFGLLRRMRATITDAEVKKEWERGKDSTWGKYVLVNAISIEFKQENAKFVRRSVRHKKQAVKMANDITRKLAAGVSFDQMVRQITERNKDPRTRDNTLRGGERRVRSADADFLLYKEALVMKDGQVSRPVETLSHIHVIKRIREYSAPTYQQVAPLIREQLARKAARNWLEEQIKDPKYVRVRWPLPQRGGADRVGDAKRRFSPANPRRGG